MRNTFLWLLVVSSVLFLGGETAWTDSGTRFEPVRRLYVSPTGSDEYSGLSPEIPFQTIGKASQVVEPGDLVLVSGGTYFENIQLKRAGTSREPIVFRAAPGETVVITHGEKPENWRNVKGARFTYSIPYEHLPHDVWEERTVTRYVEVKDLATLDRMPGAYLYDREEKTLNVHPLQGLSPEDAGIIVVRHSDYSFGRTIGTIRPGLSEFFSRCTWLWDAGIRLKASHNRVEGFVVAYQPIGIEISSDYCEARNNTVYGCREGIYIHSGDQGLVAGNECFRNYSHGIVVQTEQDAVIQNNLCWWNTQDGAFHGQTTGKTGLPYDMALYGGWLPGKISFIENTVISFHGGRVWRIKNSGGRIVMTHNVLVGGNGKVHFPRGGAGADYSHNTVIGGMLQDRHSDGNQPITPEYVKADNSVANAPLYLEDGIQGNLAFADLGHHDYRLREDSPHIGSGAFPDAAPLRYVSPRGSDMADGRTPRTAWKTISKAASSALPGETVYIQGNYKESVTISLQGEKNAPIEFRNYDRGRVVLEGDGESDCGIILKNTAYIVIDGLIIKGYKKSCVRIDNGSNIKLVNNILDGSANGVSVSGGNGISLINNTVYECEKGIDAQRSEGLILRNNLFADLLELPVNLDQATLQDAISERNVFSGAKAESRLKDWREQVRESHASLAMYADISSPDYLLPRNSRLRFLGLRHKPVGAEVAQRTFDEPPVVIEGFRAASLLPTMAILTWYTPYDYADAELRWKSADGVERSVSVRQDALLKQTSLMTRLAGLTPGKEYRVTLRVVANVVGADAREGESVITFKTPESVRRPAMLYVAPNGDDGNTGKERKQALKTLSAASLAAVPGDTVLVAPGVYSETLAIWTSGISRDQRLIFRSEKPHQAIIDCAGLRPVGIRVHGVKHVMIDGFRIRGFRSNSQDGILVTDTEDLLFANNVFERGTACDLFIAANSRDVTIYNNLFDQGWIGVKTDRCNDVTIDHNTFYHGGIGALQLYNKDASCRIVNNIFMGVMHEQKDNAPVIIYPPKQVICDYNLYWQRPRNHAKPAKKSIFNIGRENRGATNARSIEEAIEKYNVEHHGKYANPMFMDARNSDFQLKQGSPAIGMGEDGSTVGMIHFQE